MHHGGHFKALGDAAGICVAKGPVCVNHCLDLLASGDNHLAGSRQRLADALTVQRALQGLASQENALSAVPRQGCNGNVQRLRRGMQEAR